MKIGLRGGHSPNCKGAMGILDEQAEVREIYNALVPMLQAAGHVVINCNSNASTVNGELSDGTNAANSNGCDVYITIHMNASGGAGNGSEVWLYDGSNQTMNQIAANICSKFARAGFANRGTKFSTELHDLNASAMPSMIVETLFCDNQHDANLYRQIGVQGIAELIAEAITGKTITTNTEDLTEGEDIMVWKFFRITDKSKDKVYFFDGIGVRPLNHPDEKKALQQTYRECTGREIPEKLYTTKAPWYQRQQDVINRPYLKKF